MFGVQPVPLYNCITTPCYGYGAAARARGPSGQLPSLPKGTFGGFVQAGDFTAGNIVPPQIASAPIFQPVRASTRVAPTPLEREQAAINPLRPTIHATTAERDQFYADRASILARYPNYVAGAASDPLFIITDAPTAPTVVLGKTPPTILGAARNGTATESGRERGTVAVAGTLKPDRSSRKLGEQSMGWLADFGTSLLGSVDFNPNTPGIFNPDGNIYTASLPDLVGGLAGRYITSNISGGTPVALPPYVNPTTQRTTTNVPISGTRSTPVGCISQRDIDIANATGASPEMVDIILKLGRRNRRRKRMLTKSDIGDISVMRQMLGNGEAFKLWLAKATR